MKPVNLRRLATRKHRKSDAFRINASLGVKLTFWPRLKKNGDVIGFFAEPEKKNRWHNPLQKCGCAHRKVLEA